MSILPTLWRHGILKVDEPGAQEHGLDSRPESEVCAKTLPEGLSIVRQQAEKPVDVKLGQSPGTKP
jgi:hypothetical protein